MDLNWYRVFLRLFRLFCSFLLFFGLPTDKQTKFSLGSLGLLFSKVVCLLSLIDSSSSWYSTEDSDSFLYWWINFSKSSSSAVACILGSSSVNVPSNFDWVLHFATTIFGCSEVVPSLQCLNLFPRWFGVISSVLNVLTETLLLLIFSLWVYRFRLRDESSSTSFLFTSFPSMLDWPTLLISSNWSWKAISLSLDNCSPKTELPITRNQIYIFKSNKLQKLMSSILFYHNYLKWLLSPQQKHEHQHTYYHIIWYSLGLGLLHLIYLK